MNLADLALQLWNSEGAARYPAALVVIAFAGFAGEVLVRTGLRLLSWFAGRTATTYDDHVIARVRIPLRVLLVLVSFHLGFIVLGQPTLARFALVGEWLLCIFVVVETVETLLVDYFLEEKLKLRIPPLVRQLIIGVVYVGTALALLGHVFGVDVTPLLATTSVASLILGLALQAPLSNLFAGLVLHLDRTVAEGQWILVAGREGRVVHLGWRTTRLITLSDDELILPNNLMMSAEIQNFSEPARRTARNIDLPVAYDVAPEDVLTWVNDELSRIPRVLMEPAPRAWLTSFEPGFQHYTLKFWIEDFRFHDDLESDVRKALWLRFRKEGRPLRHPHPLVIEPNR